MPQAKPEPELAPAASSPVAKPAKAAPGAVIQEDVFYEGGPALGDLVTNLLFGLTLIGIPFAVGAIVRALWLRFRITSRRVTVSGGWLGRDRSQVVYSQIKEVRSVLSPAPAAARARLPVASPLTRPPEDLLRQPCALKP